MVYAAVFKKPKQNTNPLTVLVDSACRRMTEASPVCELYQKQKPFKTCIFKAYASIFAERNTHKVYCPSLCPAVEPGDFNLCGQ